MLDFTQFYQRQSNNPSTAMAMRMQGSSGVHPYGPNVPRASLAPGAAAALEQARRRQDAKNRRRWVLDKKETNLTYSRTKFYSFQSWCADFICENIDKNQYGSVMHSFFLHHRVGPNHSFNLITSYMLIYKIIHI